MNLFILDKNYNKIGILSNQGASPIAPFFDDMYTQELDTGADTYEFSTISTYLTQELLEIGNHIIFEFNNEHKLFVIIDIEFSHKNGMNTIDVYAEGIGFELLEKYADAFEIEGSYNNLLNVVLVGTGWKHEVSSKLVAIRKTKYDGEKNILAIIQDAIKTYDGAEVKFEVDYSGNKIKKKVRVFPHGGRGSHIGYRFEYGVNVNGITKKEEMPSSKDDTVLYVNNNEIGILLEYDVDVAMRSEEIAQLEIGDTHYVIDHDFVPPLTLTARVGKLEISFSDPTKNKVTLTNYKHATGSISQKTNKDDVTGIASNAAQVIIKEFELPDHEHPLPEHTHDQYALKDHTHESSGGGGSNDDLLKAPRMHSYEFLLYTNRDDNPDLTSSRRVTDGSVVDSAINDGTYLTSKEIYDFLVNDIEVYDVSYRCLDVLEQKKQGKATVEASNYCLRITPDQSIVCKDHASKDYTDGCTMPKVATRIFSDIIDPNKDRPNFDSIEKISNNHHDKHMLDVGSLTCGLVSALKYHVKKVDHGTSYFEWAKTDGSYASYLVCAKEQVTFPKGIFFDKTSPNWSSCAIDNAYRVTAQTVTQLSDKSLKENIRYIDAPTTYNNEDLLEKADLYDFIVDQLNICEYNFIGSTDNKIGFIANNYEGTKVGDKIVSRDKEGTLSYDTNNLLFSTIGALQEEVRIRDEQIANLEARLARLEALLDNNDN